MDRSKYVHFNSYICQLKLLPIMYFFFVADAARYEGYSGTGNKEGDPLGENYPCEQGGPSGVTMPMSGWIPSDR